MTKLRTLAARPRLTKRVSSSFTPPILADLPPIAGRASPTPLGVLRPVPETGTARRIEGDSFPREGPKMSWHWITRLPSGRRTKFLAIALWLVIASAVGPLAIKLADVVTDDAVAWLPRTAEATQAFERAEAAFPGSDRLVAV